MLLPLKIQRKDRSQGRPFIALINPAEIKTTSAHRYSKVQPPGTKGEAQRPDSPDDEKLSFSLVLDGTGAVPTPASGVAQEVLAQLRNLERMVGVAAALEGEPTMIPFVQILWGQFLYEGRLKSLRTSYTLFAPDSTPLRARVDLSFIAPVVVPTGSPPAAADGMPREVRARPGQSLAEICQQVYGDEVDCEEIARLNNLSALRELPMDADLFMPGLAAG
ncbi:CIS tube protein [Rhizobacter sp. P5_C2]